MNNELPNKFLNKWREEIGELNEDEMRGLMENYYLLCSRSIPAEEWYNDALSYTIRKKKDGTIRSKEEGGNVAGYFIQIIRNWVNYGRGNVGNWQDKAVIDLIERKLKIRLTYKQKGKIYELMGMYGSFAVYAVVNEIKFTSRNIREILERELPEKIEKVINESNRKGLAIYG